MSTELIGAVKNSGLENVFFLIITFRYVWKTYSSIMGLYEFKLHMSQDLTEGTFWQQKSIMRYLQRKKDLAIVNNYRKFEEIIFTNNKDMSV